LERTSWGVILDKLPRPFRHLYTLFIVMMCWVLFRADSFSIAAHYFAALFGAGPVVQAQPLQRYATREVIWALCLGTAFSMPLWAGIKNAGEKLSGFVPEKLQPAYFGIGQVLETVAVLALLLISSAWMAGGTYNPFIYFRF
jgi:alginate O-acetyltransferase complex protein AlgI